MYKNASILRSISMMLAIFLLPAVHIMSQEIRVSAPEDVFENDVFQVEYEIFGYDSQQTYSLVNKDFEQIGEPKRIRVMPSFFSGRGYHSLKIIYNFRAKKAGTLNLPQIELMSEGKKIKSEGRKIVVVKLPKMEDAKCFVEVDLTKQSIKIGDTLTVTYKLYSTKEISNIRNMRVPRIRDFYYKDISPDRLPYTEEKINGINYKVYILCKYMLQAARLGVKEIPEGSVDIEYAYPTGRERQDAWGRIYEEQIRENVPCVIPSISMRVHDMITV